MDLVAQIIESHFLFSSDDFYLFIFFDIFIFVRQFKADRLDTFSFDVFKVFYAFTKPLKSFKVESVMNVWEEILTRVRFRTIGFVWHTAETLDLILSII